MESFVPSRFNFHVPVGNSSLLYNTNSGALLRFDGEDGRQLGTWLCETPSDDLADRIPASIAELLVEGGFLVAEDCDELGAIRERYWRARSETPLVLTITTTQDCNLGCFYCYEERSRDRLADGDVDSLLRFARERIVSRNALSLHVDWYGGEPLLNVAFLETASIALQALCRELKVIYNASVISNGTCWPQDPASFARRHALRQVQISFDGMRERHNRSRRYRKGYGSGEDSSFDQAVELVDSLLDATRVDIRLNIGNHNRQDVEPFLEMARARGWFQRKYPAVIQPARLSAFTDHCGFLRPNEMSQTEFDTLRRRIREVLNGETIVEETEAPDGLPLPKTSVCAALSNNSAVIGADGLEYRCGLQVGNAQHATSRLLTEASPFPILAQENFPDRTWWEQFDPTLQPTCSRCSFLPICLGGCPHKHLTGDRHALDEQGAYWRANLPRLIAERAGFELDQSFSFTEPDQFRLESVTPT